MMATRKSVGLSTLALLLGGCAFGPQMQRVAIDQNAMIADTANELTLVNILRARDREPLHFTSIAKATGSATLGGKASGNVAIKGSTPVEKTGVGGTLIDTTTTPGVEVTTPALEASIVAGSSLDIAIFDTQEFYQGIQTSLTSEQVAHYLHQGWPPELLMYLMIESVDFVPRSSLTTPVETVWRNDPGHETDRLAFAQFVGTYPISLGMRPDKKDYIAPASEVVGSTLADFLALEGKRFTIEQRSDQDPTLWLVRKSSGGDEVAISLQPSETAVQSATSPINKSFFVSTSVEQSRSPDHSVIAQGYRTVNDVRTDGDFRISLRSVESIIYYLGETLRKKENMPILCVSKDLSLAASPARSGERTERQETTNETICKPDKRPIRLLVVEKERPETGVFIQARFRGENWYAPHDPNLETSRTSQVIALIQQLVNLQKLSKDKPTTQSIRIVQ